MSVLFVWLWLAGGPPAAVLGEIVRAESPRIARAGRIAFALLLGGDLLLAAVFLSVGNDAATVHATRSIWWLTVVLGGIPLALVSGLAVRRGYAGHRPVLAVAVLATALLYLAFPLSYIPATQPLPQHGLARFAHDHHWLDIAILLIPTLILLADELRRRREVAHELESERPSLHSFVGSLGRRNLVVAAVLLLALVWTAGTNSVGMVAGLAVVFAGFALFLWRRNRSTMRGVLEDLRPPEKP
jgi:hypothetical protein